MQVVVWILIILLVIFLVWLLRRWIKRLILILIFLVLAFLIYGIFNPSGAARLWYNIRTFPQRVTSRMSSSKEFLDYDNYKLNLPSVGDKIGDEIDLGVDEIKDLDLEDEINMDLKSDEKNGRDSDKKDVKMEKDYERTEEKVGKQTIKAFPRSIKFVEMPNMKEESKSENFEILNGSQKSDLLGVINKYIEKNLDDNTDILVTVEYEEDSENLKKIILQTQPKKGKAHSVSFSRTLLNDLSKSEEWGEVIVVPAEDIVIEKSDFQEVTTNQSSNKTVSNKTVTNKSTSSKLTQKEQKEAEEIFSILF